MAGAAGAVGLAGARWSGRREVSCFGRVSAGGQAVGSGPVSGGLVVGVELLQGPDRGGARGAEALFRAGGLPGGDFGPEDGSGVLRAGPGPGGAAPGRGSGGVADPGCFHDPGEVVDAGGRLVSGGGHQAACSSKSLLVGPRAWS